MRAKTEVNAAISENASIKENAIGKLGKQILNFRAELCSSVLLSLSSGQLARRAADLGEIKSIVRP